MRGIGAQTAGHQRQFAGAQAAGAQQPVRFLLHPLHHQLEIVQQAEGGAGGGPVDQGGVPPAPGDLRGFAGHGFRR